MQDLSKKINKSSLPPQRISQDKQACVRIHATQQIILHPREAILQCKTQAMLASPIKNGRAISSRLSEACLVSALVDGAAYVGELIVGGLDNVAASTRWWVAVDCRCGLDEVEAVPTIELSLSYC